MAAGPRPRLAALADLRPLRAELDRIGASYAEAGAAAYVALHDLGEHVWIKGLPLSGLSWRGRPEAALRRLEGVPDGAGVDALWAALRD